MDYMQVYSSPLGPMTMASDGIALTGLRFDLQSHSAADPAPVRAPWALPVFDQTAAWLDAYFSGTIPGEAPPLLPRGTDFQRSVWDLLLTILYGQTVTYGELAKQLHSSARAVGGAVGRNPIAILIPCHRVVGVDGLTGYGAGLDRKIALLHLEGAPLPAPFFELSAN